MAIHETFDETILNENLSFGVLYPSAKDPAPPAPVYRPRVSEEIKEPFDWSGILIVSVVLAFIVIAALPTYSASFREATGISSWLKTIENVLAVQPRGTYEGTKQGIIPAPPP